MTMQLQYALAISIYLISMDCYLSSLQSPHGINFQMLQTLMTSTFFRATCSTLHFLRQTMPMHGSFLSIEQKSTTKDSCSAELSDPILGMGRITSSDIMNHVRTQYGTLTSNNYKLLYVQLTNKLDSPANFTGFAADQRFIFQQLASQGQPIPKLQQYDY